MLISVIIPAFNEEKLIGACLESLAQQTSQPDEIVVVDNASTDSTPAIVQHFIESHPQLVIKMIREMQKGSSPARDAGWRTASGDVIVNIDSDETFPKTWLEHIRATLQRYPDVEVIGGAVRFEHAPPMLAAIQFLYTYVYPYWRKWNKGYFYLRGAQLITQRHVLEAMNGFAGTPGDGREDKHLSKQAVKLGFKVRYDPSIYGIYSLRRYKKGGLSGFMTWDTSDVR